MSIWRSLLYGIQLYWICITFINLPKHSLTYPKIFKINLTYEMLTVRRQQHSFSTHKLMFLCESVKVFETENVSTWGGLEPPTFGFICVQLPKLCISTICLYRTQEKPLPKATLHTGSLPLATGQWDMGSPAKECFSELWLVIVKLLFITTDIWLFQIKHAVHLKKYANDFYFVVFVMVKYWIVLPISTRVISSITTQNFFLQKLCHP